MKTWIKKSGIFFLVMFFVFGIINYVYINTDKELADVADKLIRLHIVANSDSMEDQALKRKVRDEVIRQMSPKFEDLKDVSEVESVIESNLGLIEDIANQVVKQENKSYGAQAMLGSFDFPTKVYGNLVLPAGNYQALKVVLGQGEGQNWWCVMFPPLCFIDIAHGVVPEDTMDELKESLTEEEFELLTASKTESETPVKLKFKIFEIAKSMNQKIAQIGQR
ncbi:MAG: spoIIR [Clostridia bacterium]|jgi:stage II sporulation protein R|nr:spoIIR [Clostridia bacterium]